MNFFARKENILLCVVAVCTVAGYMTSDWRWLLAAIVAMLFWLSLANQITLVWKSPDLYRYAGIFLKCGNKRYRLMRFGRM